MDTAKARNLDRPNQSRVTPERGHPCKDKVAIPSGCVQPMLSRAVEEMGIDPIFCRPGQPMG